MRPLSARLAAAFAKGKKKKNRLPRKQSGSTARKLSEEEEANNTTPGELRIPYMVLLAHFKRKETKTLDVLHENIPELRKRNISLFNPLCVCLVA